MATKANQKKAQALVDAADKEYEQAKTEQELKQWVETHLQMLNEAVSLDPDNSNAWNDRGLAKHELGDHHGAIADHTKAIKLNPKDAAAWNNRGFTKYRLEKFDEAISDLREAIRLSPSNQTVSNNLQAAEIALISHESAKNPKKIRRNITNT